ncbi:MAG: hypothetical protein ACP5NZ_04770 [Nanobdellota archaeon]
MDENQKLESKVHEYKLRYIEGGISHAKLWLYSGTESEKRYGAEVLLNYWIERYNVLSDEEKKNISFNVFEDNKNAISVNINDLEKKAVEVLVKQGHSNVVDESLLKKYGYSPTSGDYFGEKLVKGRQNPNTK